MFKKYLRTTNITDKSEWTKVNSANDRGLVLHRTDTFEVKYSEAGLYYVSAILNSNTKGVPGGASICTTMVAYHVPNVTLSFRVREDLFRSYTKFVIGYNHWDKHIDMVMKRIDGVISTVIADSFFRVR